MSRELDALVVEVATESRVAGVCKNCRKLFCEMHEACRHLRIFHHWVDLGVPIPENI